MPHQLRHTEDSIRAAFEEAEDIHDIMAILNVSNITVRNYARRYGLTIPGMAQHGGPRRAGKTAAQHGRKGGLVKSRENRLKEAMKQDPTIRRVPLDEYERSGGVMVIRK